MIFFKVLLAKAAKTTLNGGGFQRASLWGVNQKLSIIFNHEPCFGVNTNSNIPSGIVARNRRVSFGLVGRVVI